MNRNILWIGNQDRSEFARIIQQLQRTNEVSFSRLPSSSRNKVAAACVAWSRPGEYSQKDYEGLSTAFPSTPIIHVLGEMCCGMKRTSSLLQDKDCFYTHELPSNLSLNDLSGFQSDNASLPILLDPSELAAVYSASVSHRQAVADSLAMIGVKTVELRLDATAPIQGVDVVIWDDAGYTEAVDILRLRKRHPNAKILILATYPREYELEQYRQHGVHVLAQPYRLRELFTIFGKRGEFLASSAA